MRFLTYIRLRFDYNKLFFVCNHFEFVAATGVVFTMVGFCALPEDVIKSQAQDFPAGMKKSRDSGSVYCHTK